MPSTVASELITALSAFAGKHRLPKVRALHLPPAGITDSRDAEFCALELADGTLGLSYARLDSDLARLSSTALGDLAGADPLALAARYSDPASARRVVGFAAINALSRLLFDRAGFQPEFDVDSIGSLDPQPEDRIGMIGFFRPLIPRIVASGAALTVVELNPEFVGDFAGYRVTLDASALSTCNKVVSTSTLLLNDTLNETLAHCRSAEALVMVGPGAGCLPDPLFARGVTLLGGAWIDDGPRVVDALRAGEKWSAFSRKFALRRKRYPGVGTLLARLDRGLDR